MYVSGQRKEDANLSCYLPAAQYFTVFLTLDTRYFFQRIPHTITQRSSVISPSYSSSTHIIPALFTIHNTYQWNLPFLINTLLPEIHVSAEATVLKKDKPHYTVAVKAVTPQLNEMVISQHSLANLTATSLRGRSYSQRTLPSSQFLH